MADEPARRLLFDFFIHEAETVNLRADWFLIFHGILFEAFLAAHFTLHRVTLGVLGCLASYVWLAVGIRQTWDLKHLVDSVSSEVIMGTEEGRLFRRLFEARRQHQPWWMKWARSTPAFCIVLPCGCLTAWLIVTVTALDGRLAWRVPLPTLAVLIASTALAVILQSGPEVKEAAILHLTQLLSADGSSKSRPGP
jgi:hypothetical protein